MALTHLSFSLTIFFKGVTFKLEKMRSPQIWQTTVTDVRNHGNHSLPEAAVFTVLKVEHNLGCAYVHD
jgi:hypothetical protein